MNLVTILTSVGILAYIILVWFGTAPEFYTSHIVLRPFQKLMESLCLECSWCMFAPVPAKSNVYIEAEIHFSDGRVVLKRTTRCSHYTGIRACIQVRDRKWMEHLFGNKEATECHIDKLIRDVVLRSEEAPSWVFLFCRNQDLAKFPKITDPLPESQYPKFIMCSYEVATKTLRQAGEAHVDGIFSA